jgi:hypothetical protein
VFKRLDTARGQGGRSWVPLFGLLCCSAIALSWLAERHPTTTRAGDMVAVLIDRDAVVAHVESELAELLDALDLGD